MEFSEYFPIWNKLTPEQQGRLRDVTELQKIPKGTVVHDGSPECKGMVLVKSLFGLNGNALTGFTSEIQLKSHSILLAVSIVASTPLMKVLRQKVEAWAQSHGPVSPVCTAWNVVFYSILPVILLLLSTAGLVGDSYNPFIYFQF